MARPLRRGEQVVYRRWLRSTSPRPGAKNVQAAPHGEDYTYYLDEFCTVVDVRAEGKLVLQTPTGQVHVVTGDDPALRRASWRDRLFRRRPAADQPQAISST
jgi:hypothetical protein